MRGRPGRGALVGLAVGVVLVGLLIWLPAALRGDYYEIGDPLVAMGVPMIVVGASVGALIGVAGSRATAPDAGGPAGVAGSRQPTPRARALVAAASVAAASLAVWLFLWATGFVSASPLGLG